MKKRLLISLLTLACIVAPASTMTNAKNITKMDSNISINRFNDSDFDLYGFTYSRNNNTFTIDIYGGMAPNSGYGMNIVSTSEVNGKIIVKVEFTKPNPKYSYLDVVRQIRRSVTFESSTATSVQVVTSDGASLPYLN